MGSAVQTCEATILGASQQSASVAGRKVMKAAQTHFQASPAARKSGKLRSGLTLG
jgi:hypothetical protein